MTQTLVPSRNPWIGAIPITWREAHLRRYAKLLTGGTPDRSRAEYWDNGTIPWIASGEVNKRRISEASARITSEGLKGSSARWLPPGTVLVALAGQGKTKGTAALLEIWATCNQSLAALIPDEKNLHCRFLHYYLESQYSNLRGMVGDEQRDGLSLTHLAGLWVPLPAISLQRYIAEFLDRKTTAIDTLMEKKERLIALLAEKRTAIIHRAVTKGLNPDVQMCDSGIPWIGQIPAHWEVRRLRHIAARLQGRLIVQPHLYFADEGVPIVFGYNIKDGRIVEEGLSKISFEADQQHPHARAKAGDLYTIRLGDPGMTAVVPPSLEGCHFASIMWIHQHSRFDSHWLCHCMNSRVLQGQIEAVNYGAAQTQFNIGEAVDFLLPFPPKEEQAAIAVHITRLLEQNIAVRSRLSVQIDRLREYRQGLITAAVTGQLDIGGSSP